MKKNIFFKVVAIFRAFSKFFGGAKNDEWSEISHLFHPKVWPDKGNTKIILFFFWMCMWLQQLFPFLPCIICAPLFLFKRKICLARSKIRDFLYIFVGVGHVAPIRFLEKVFFRGVELKRKGKNGRQFQLIFGFHIYFMQISYNANS